jgi:protein TonB
MFSGLDTVQPHLARRWTAALSFTLQAALVAAALVLPLFKPESLPDAFARRPIFRPMPRGVDHPAPTHPTANLGPSQAPVYPILVNQGPSVRTPVAGPDVSGSVGPPNVQIGDPNSNVINSVLSDNNVRPMPHPPAAVVHHPAPVSVIMEGNLERKIEPRYPVIARQAGIQGTVLINALISRQGTIERAQVVSGSPVLAAAALDAVRQWKYRPYYLNSEPVEVETEITVNFVLNK